MNDQQWQAVRHDRQRHLGRPFVSADDAKEYIEKSGRVWIGCNHQARVVFYANKGKGVIA